MPSPTRSPLFDGGESSAPSAAVSGRIRVQLRRWLPLPLGLAAVALGLYAQWLITSRGAIQQGVYWYLAAVVTLVVGWRGSERDRRCISLIPDPPERSRESSDQRRRRSVLVVTLVLLGASLNGLSILRMRTAGYDSWLAGAGWLASLLLLAVAALAFSGRSRRSGGLRHRLGWTAASRSEVLLFVVILLVHWGFRLYRLGDWTTGIHGDEGEAGMDALAILQGRHVSPFANGWYAQSNFYYWGVALGLALFGTDLAGLRAFAAVLGGLLILPFYLLVRRWFGVRTALIASVLLAVSDVTIHFSRQEFSNITTPFLLTCGAYFFFRGLRSHRLIDFVLAGFSHALGLYFYGGGRLTPLLWGAFLLYLFVALPIVRLPRTYRRLRRRTTTSRRVAIARALRFEARPLRTFSAGLAAYLLALVCVASPWVSYYFDHLDEGNARAREKVIFNNQERMAVRYGADHLPLYLGVQSPFTPEGLRAPLVLRRTGATLRVLKDGFWPRVVWGQLGATLSILTHSLDGSSVYTFTGKPVAKPVEATLIFLGLGWALSRWRDTRMACLSIWFWSTIFVGGVMTIDAPYMARLVGILPAIAVFAALVLGKLWTEAEKATGAPRARSAVARGLRLVMAAAVVGLLGFLAWQNFRDYYFRYVGPQAFTAGTGQAIFVRDMNRRLFDDGLAPARFYHLGVHYIYWGYGPNRFLNHEIRGADAANVAEVLPIVDDDSATAVFMVWPINQQYLPILKDYYPGGIEEPFHYGRPEQTDPLLVSYRVPRQEIVARRQQLASYRPVVGPPLERRESGLGTLDPPPPGLSYPVDARWSGAFFVPQFGRYRFQLTSSGGGDAPALAIDDVPVVRAGEGEVADETVVLARGLHRIELTGKLLNSASKIAVLFATGAGTPQPIPSALLWSSGGGSLLGEVRSSAGESGAAQPAAGADTASRPPVRRLDGFLGFRDLRAVYPERAPVAATWRGTLKAAAAGRYEFRVYASGRSRVLIDGVPVVELDSHPQPQWGSGSVELAAAPHPLMVEYEGVAESGYLELYWRPPGGTEVLLGPSQLEPAAGVWRVGEVEAPELPAQQTLDQPGPAATELVRGKGLSYPYALAVTPGGDIVVADSRNHRLVLFDRSGRKLDTWGEEGDDLGEFGVIEDIAIGADGSIYVLESRPGRIQRLRADGTPDAVVAEGAWCSPNGLDVDERGQLYIAETCGNRVLQLDAAGTVVRAFAGGADAATRFEQPVDVAVGEAGDLFVADLRGRIARVDPASDQILEAWPLHVGTAVASASVAVSGSLLYVTDPDMHVVYRVDTGTGAVDRVGRPGPGPGEFTTPLGIAVGRQGEVYVGDGETGRVQVFNGLANLGP